MKTLPNEAKAIFLEAIDQPSPEERARFLDERCGKDSQLRSRVGQLLAAHGAAGEFLGGSWAVEPEDEASLSESPGTLIGRYQLKEIIGEGGFGDVWLAEQQEPVKRQVALKIIKLGMDTKQVVARFEAERQALALMEHPHIAKVFDAGATEAGRPYFVMELVRGTPITDFCDEHRLSIPERLGLFMKVCGAVQHAHQKGIIHRDLKPTNILVTQHDGQPVPKVIDFGIAKAIQQRLTEQTVYTAYHQFIGTPEYMSPEQAEHSDQDIDTRSDIYSLGVLLYELLVGITPFDREQLKSHGYSEICRVIRESEPATPSRSLSSLGATLGDVAGHREVTPGDLGKRLRGDLDWIVMKALEKERGRRYENASALGGDIERHLNDEPITARPASSVYRLQKLARKHRGPVVAISGIVASLLIGLVGITMLYLRSQELTERQQQMLYVAHTATAYEAWEDGDLRRVDELLRRQQPQSGESDRRGFEWHYLRNLYDDNVEGPTLPHDRPLRSMALSPDGQFLATATNESVHLWQYATHKRLYTLEGKHPVAFSPNGTLLASGGPGKVVRLWDVTTGKLRQTLQQDSSISSIGSIAFSPDGKRLAVGAGEGDGYESGYLRIWDVASGKEAQTLAGHRATVASLAWSDQAGILVSGSWDRTVKVWDANTFQLRYTFAKHSNRVRAIAISPDGKKIASGGQSGRIMVWEPMRDGEPTYLLWQGGPVDRLAFAPDSRLLAAGYANNAVAVWDLERGSLRTVIRGHLAEVDSSRGIRGLSFSVDGLKVVSAGGRTVRFSEIQATSAEPGHGDWWSSIAVCGQLGSVAMANAEMTAVPRAAELVLWDLAGRAPKLFRFQKNNNTFGAVAASQDGKLLVTGETSGEVRLWDVSTGKALEVLGQHPLPVMSLAISPNGTTIASGDRGSPSIWTADPSDWAATINMWDPETGKLRRSFRLDRFVAQRMCFSPDGQLLAVGGGTWKTGAVKLIRVADGSEQLSLTTPRLVFGVAFSPDGATLACADFGGTLMLFDLTTGDVNTLTPPGHGSFNAVAFSPDGKTLATGSRDGTLTLWNVSAADKVTEFQLGARVSSLAFLPGDKASPDGTALAAGCGDRSLHVWHADGRTVVLRSPLQLSDDGQQSAQTDEDKKSTKHSLSSE